MENMYSYVKVPFYGKYNKSNYKYSNNKHQPAIFKISVSYANIIRIEYISKEL